MADPKYTIQRTGSEVANAIEKALVSAKRSDTATKVVTEVKFTDNKTVYTAEVIPDTDNAENNTLVLTAVTLETTTDDIYEAEVNTASATTPPGQ